MCIYHLLKWINKKKEQENLKTEKKNIEGVLLVKWTLRSIRYKLRIQVVHIHLKYFFVALHSTQKICIHRHSFPPGYVIVSTYLLYIFVFILEEKKKEKQIKRRKKNCTYEVCSFVYFRCCYVTFVFWNSNAVKFCWCMTTIKKCRILSTSILKVSKLSFISKKVVMQLIGKEVDSQCDTLFISSFGVD